MVYGTNRPQTFVNVLGAVYSSGIFCATLGVMLEGCSTKEAEGVRGAMGQRKAETLKYQMP